MLRFPARYNDGVTARTRMVEAVLEADALVVLERDGGAELDRWPRASVRLLDRPNETGDKRLTAGAGDTARLIVADDRVIAALMAALPELRRAERGDRRTVRRVWVLGIGAIVSILLILFVFLPHLSGAVASAVPDSVARELGESTFESMADFAALGGGREAPACTAPAGREVLDGLVRRLAAASDYDGPLEVRVLDWSLVNAFALPGGIVVLTDGMIEFAGSPEALAGVIAHEIGHVAGRDPLRAMVQAAGVSVILGLLIGDVTGGGALVLASETLINARYSQAVEEVADGHAVRTLNSAGIDARPLADFFERLLGDMAELEEALRIISTHPPSAERAGVIRAAAGARGGAMTAAEWAALQAICTQ
ncbi:MAG: M48 family metallopeptidase [Rhodospirillaceae bacterium]|nr:M48 family metallopeptidase [Rhodospirillaceae bacterium]MBT6118404.1 M48 family metallopeptidase [Rhodospirillaceae bacterium]